MTFFVMVVTLNFAQVNLYLLALLNRGGVDNRSWSVGILTLALNFKA